MARQKIQKSLLENLDKDYLESIRILYDELKIRCDQLPFCYDISDTVPPSGDVYSNPRHHNAKGNEMLAKVIWGAVSNDMPLEENILNGH